MRRTITRIHLWLGLTVGFVWALQGLTGASLVFFRELDRLSGPSATVGSMAPLDAIVESAKQAANGAPIVRLSVVDRHRDLVSALYNERASGAQPSHEHAKRPRTVLIDAATAKPLGTRDDEPTTPFAGSATRWLILLHTSMLGGHNGQILIAVSGLILLSSVLCGLWMGWPPKRGWKAAYSFRRWRTTEQRLYGWHRALGLTIGVVIISQTITGSFMNFEESVRDFLVRIVPHEETYHPVPAKKLSVAISAQQALQIAQARFPQAGWVRIVMPSLSQPVYNIRFHQPGDSRAWSGRTTVVVDPADGKILYVYDTRNAPLSNRVIEAALPLHDGELVGLLGRVIVMLTGLAVPTLYITGLVRWQRQNKRKRERARTTAVGA